MLMVLSNQIAALFILSVPVACISWTFTHEEIFSEINKYCVKCSEQSKNLFKKKFFYLFTCEYCFSHYITAIILIITKYHLLYDDWRGYLIGGFSIVWIANIYMSIYGRIRINLKKEKIEADIIEEEKKNNDL
ncbi:MAG: hypothetical protein ABI405_02350 [Parafilimonas sp.]